MAKAKDEIAAEIVQALIQARGTVIVGTNNRKDYLEKYLSDEAVTEAFKTIFKAVNNPLD